MATTPFLDHAGHSGLFTLLKAPICFYIRDIALSVPFLNAFPPTFHMTHALISFHLCLVTIQERPSLNYPIWNNPANPPCISLLKIIHNIYYCVIVLYMYLLTALCCVSYTKM